MKYPQGPVRSVFRRMGVRVCPFHKLFAHGFVVRAPSSSVSRKPDYSKIMYGVRARHSQKFRAHPLKALHLLQVLKRFLQQGDLTASWARCTTGSSCGSIAMRADVAPLLTAGKICFFYGIPYFPVMPRNKFIGKRRTKRHGTACKQPLINRDVKER